MDGCLLLTMMLPGKFARSVRMKAANLLKKWIHDNTNDSLLREMTAEPASTLGKRTRDDLELEERRLAIREREALLLQVPLIVKERELANHNMLVQAVQCMCPGNVLDDRARLLFKDRAMNLMQGGETPAVGMITDGDGSPKSISDIVAAMGKTFKPKDMIKIGAIAAAKYRERYGDDATPPKHPQWVNGRSCAVNHYCLKDHDIVQDAVCEFTG